MDKTCDQCKDAAATSYSTLIIFMADCEEGRFYRCDDCLKEHQDILKEHEERLDKEYEKEMKDKYGITLVDNCLCGERIKRRGRFMRRAPNLCHECEHKAEGEIIAGIRRQEIREKYGDQ